MAGTPQRNHNVPDENVIIIMDCVNIAALGALFMVKEGKSHFFSNENNNLLVGLWPL